MFKKKMMGMLTGAMTLAIGAGGALAEEVAEHAAEKHEAGLLDINVAQIVWVLVIFVVLLAILYKTAWKNVLAGLEAREKRIRTDIADAEAARVKAEATLKEFNTQLATAENRVREMLSKATVDGEKLAATIRAQAQQEAQEIKERANKEIEATKDQALAEIYEKTADLATSVAEKILRRNLNANDQRDLVNGSLAQLDKLKN